MAVTPAGARGQAGLPNIQAQIESDKKKKSDYAAKVQRQKDRVAAKKQLEANAGGAYGGVIDSITQSRYASGDPLKLTGRLLYQGKEVTANELLNKFFRWSPEEVNAFDRQLKSLSIVDPSKNVDPDFRKSIYTDAVARASQFYALSDGTNKDSGSLEGTLNAYKGQFSSSQAPNLPDRRVQNLPDSTINAIIDNISQVKLKRDINDPVQRAELLKKIKAQLAEGTVTTNKKVKNPKTGKLENVSVSSGMNLEDIQIQIGKELETSNAQDYELSKRLEFHSELDKIFARSA
jgi:hypothetical protein